MERRSHHLVVSVAAVVSVVSVAAVAAVALAFGLAAGPARAVVSAGEAAPGAADLARYVNPFDGTQAGAPDFGTGGGAGNTFPGPVLPFGMIQWGPDTSPGSQNLGGGYAYDDTTIRGFSLRRLTGAGCANYGDVPFLPTVASVTSSPAEPPSGGLNPALLPSFSHRDEAASPGSYRVELNPGSATAIGVQLTATRRSGLGRFTFPADGSGSVLIDVTGSRGGAANGAVQVGPSRQEVSGSVQSGGFCVEPSRYRLYFDARFSRPFHRFGTWTGGALAPGSRSAADSVPVVPWALGAPGVSAQTGAYVGFDTSRDRVVEMRVGISFVSVENARANLDAETDGLSFNAARAAARTAWDRMLGRIDVHGGRSVDRRTFYSMLYHALIAPSTFSDADGRYIGMDGRVHSARGYTQYADFSGWDVYRSQMPLLALIAPRQASDIVSSLLADQAQSGWLPKWSIANAQTQIMTGDPADPTMAAIWALGGHGFNLRAALAAAVKGATASGRSANDGYVERPAGGSYQRLGYVPHEQNANVASESVDAWRRTQPGPYRPSLDLAWGSAGTTLEYATDDFAVARLAADTGDRATCRRFLARSGNWRNVLDRATGYVRPRWSNGRFVTPFDPNRNDRLSSQGFAEGDAAQYTWMVPQDPAGLFRALGGSRTSVRRLDRLFVRLNAGFSSPYAFLGNEPNANAPWLYDWAGAPYRTQSVVRRAIMSLYNPTAAGYPGNDDLGQMSAWYVFATLGLYPEVPGTDVLALGSPLFPRTDLRLPGGVVSITARGAAPRAPYVQRLALGGRTWNRPWLRLADIARGAHLSFVLGPAPNRGWGSRPSARPPSYGPGDAAACASP